MKIEYDDAFTAFVAARSRHLLQTAYLLTGDRHRAEDLLQTALTRAYLRWDRIVSDDPEGYVRRTLANAHIDWWRRKPWREEPTGELPEVAADDGATAYAVRQSVLQALAVLPRRQRAVVVLRYYGPPPATRDGCGAHPGRGHGGARGRPVGRHVGTRAAGGVRADRGVDGAGFRRPVWSAIVQDELGPVRYYAGYDASGAEVARQAG
ncbi:MAG: polymerase, sigma-24 subunit, subfamily [Frankiales bacterium]|nr:polymerase, sigma-24 subunit, subfamily [Frankiales bacterium]